MVTVWLKVPDFPVTVIVDVLAAAEGDTASVRMQLAGVVPPLNDPVTPLGRPERLAATAPEKPF